jgi:hypothetical protein
MVLRKSYVDRACVPAPLCADAYADAKSFVEIPAIAEIDDAIERGDR